MSVFNLHFKLIFNKNSIWLWGLSFSVLFSLLIVGLAFNHYYQNRIYQNITIDNINVGGLTKIEALDKLQKSQSPVTISGELVVSTLDYQHNTVQRSIDYQQLIAGKDYATAIDQALMIGKNEYFLKNTWSIIKLLKQPANVRTNYLFNQTLITQTVAALAQAIDHQGRAFAITIDEQQKLVVDLGEDSRELLQAETITKINHTLGQIINGYDLEEIPAQITVEAPTLESKNTFNETEQAQSLQRAQTLADTSINIYGYDFELDQTAINSQEPPKNWTVQKTVTSAQLLELLTWPTGINQEKITALVSQIATEINRPATNAEFEYDATTLKATKFAPGLPGLELDQSATQAEIVKIIQHWDEIIATANDLSPEETNKTIFLSLKHTLPDVQLADTNHLGIKELIGFGDSHYYHSIPARVHNVGVATEKLNFTIVPPQASFSFNQAVGEVSSETGFQQAYVIRSGQTLLESGGGVCQVSTTTFRALLDAGVDITRRLPHSYRVSYYEFDNKPGFDATVYSGNVDLRFTNDTPGHILIVAQADANQLYMTVKIYGTDDGRTSEIKNYKQWGYAAPPPAQEIPDASLAPGQRRKVENAIAGIKTSFDWLVLDATGQVLHEKTFTSNYQAWGEKWLVGI